jgi:hypothetical protein
MAELQDLADGFIELVCADDELLAAEFDAIIHDGWDDSFPGCGPTTSTDTADPPVPGGMPRPGPSDQIPGPSPALGRRWSRQRSPPGSFSTAHAAQRRASIQNRYRDEEGDSWS